jgi:alanyl-tRNA synthetase
VGVDTDGFSAAMEKAKAEARRSWAGSGEKAGDRVWFELREKLGASEFLGYDTENAEGKLHEAEGAVQPGHSLCACVRRKS